MGQSLVGLTMVYILSITSLLVVLLELTQAAPAPFLLDLLAPRITVRRQGKQIDDGYGVPQDSYGVPEEQVAESSSYDAPKPSYSTTTSTAAPSYSAPAAQNTGGFPDILGFIGNIIKPKLRTENQLESGILGNGCLLPPVDSAYGAPQETSYEAPQSNAYEVPKSTAYEAPKSETYEAPKAETYEAPQAETYEAPQSEA